MSMTIPEYGGCPWPMDPSCVAEEWAAFEEPVQVQALALASSTLGRLTGYRVSNCPITVRPMPSRGKCLIPGRSSFNPNINTLGQWVNIESPSMCEIALPRPVGRVDEVRVNGSIMHIDYYQIDNGNLLTYVGPGPCPWPMAQDMALPDTEPNTFSVTYLNAYPVDALGAQAVAFLALEFAKACVSSKKCALSTSVRAVVRQGVTYEIQPGLFPDGFTGIIQADAYISMWNPKGLTRGATIWSPSSSTTRTNTTSRPTPLTEILDGGDA